MAFPPPNPSIIGTGGNYADPGAWAVDLKDQNLGGITYTGKCLNQTFTIGAINFGAVSNGGIILTTQTGASFRDNVNVRTNALFYVAANGAAINMQDNYMTIASGSSSFPLTISNLQFTNAKLDNYGGVANINDCIWLGPNGASVVSAIENSSATVKVRRSWLGVYGPSGAIINCVGAGVVDAYGCTLINTGASASILASVSGLTVLFSNCAFFGGSLSSFDVNGLSGVTSTFQNCASDLSSAPAGVLTGLVDANQFVNTGGDWRELNSSAGIYGTGVADATNNAVDITGTTRKNPPDIGAWEIPAVGGSHGVGPMLLPGIPGLIVPVAGGAALRGARLLVENPLMTRRTLLLPRARDRC